MSIETWKPLSSLSRVVAVAGLPCGEDGGLRACVLRLAEEESGEAA